MVDAAAEFWRFSLTVYARPGVAASCVAALLVGLAADGVLCG